MMTVIIVDVLDEEGYELGRTVPVEIEYSTHAERYGEDADGHRGAILLSHECEDVYIGPDHIANMNSAQVEQVLKDARTAFEERGPR